MCGEMARVRGQSPAAEVLLPIVALGDTRRLEEGARRLQGEVLARVDFVLHGGDETAMLAAAEFVPPGPATHAMWTF